MDTVDLDGELQLKEGKSSELWRQYEAISIFTVIYGHDENLNKC